MLGWIVPSEMASTVAGGADCGDEPRAGSEACRAESEACRAESEACRPAAPGQVPAAPGQVPAARDQVPAALGERRPVAMTPYAIAVALFAAFVVGGILAKAVPLWLVAVIGLAIGAAVFVFVDRYPRLPRSR